METDLKISCSDYHKIEKTIHLLTKRNDEQPTLKAVTASVGVSESHLQKLFLRWAGISLEEFLQYLSKEHVKSLLEERSVLAPPTKTVLCNKSRSHDFLINHEAITPDEYKKEGTNIVIRYGAHETPFGKCIIATTDKGICKLAFLNHENSDEANRIKELYCDWSLAIIHLDNQVTGKIIQQIFQPSTNPPKPLNLFLKGTHFQLKVWAALLKIPTGQLVSYQTIANKIETPNGTRAVGSAIGKNPVALLIPCHRIIRKSGEINQYRWGTDRKQALIAWESAKNREHHYHSG